MSLLKKKSSMSFKELGEEEQKNILNDYKIGKIKTRNK